MPIERKKTVEEDGQEVAASDQTVASEPAEVPDQPKVSEPTPASSQFEIVLARPASLGTGTRAKGEKLGTVILEPGVSARELGMALVNPQLWQS